MLCPSETDVQQAEAVVVGLGGGVMLARRRFLLVDRAGPLLFRRHVDDAVAVRVGVDRRSAVRRDLPLQRQQHDRVFEALAAVERGDLDRLGVAVDAAHLVAEFVGHRRIGPETVEQTVGARRRGSRGAEFGGELLGDVIEVGQPPLAIRVAEQLGDQVALGAHLVVPGQERPRRQSLRPGGEVALEFSEHDSGVGGFRVEVDGTASQEHAEARGARRRGGGRAFHGRQQDRPLGGGRSHEHATGAGTHRGHSSARQRSRHRVGVGVVRHEHGDVARSNQGGASLARDGVVRQQIDDGGRQVSHDRATPERGRELAGRAEQRGVGSQPTHLQRVPRSECSRGGCRRGGDRGADDALVPELDAVHKGVCGGDEVGVAAPVRGQVHRGRPLRGPQVGVHVGAAEPVDRLLGITHGDEPVVEGSLENLPLHRIGVLKLVDHDERVALPQPFDDRGAMLGIVDGAVQTRDEVVVAEFLAGPSSLAHLLGGLADEGDPPSQPLDGVVLAWRGRGRVGDRRGTRVTQESLDGTGQRAEHRGWREAGRRPDEAARGYDE